MRLLLCRSASSWPCPHLRIRLLVRCRWGPPCAGTTSLARKKSGCAAVTLLFLLARWARLATTWSALETLRRAHLAVWDAEPRMPFAARWGPPPAGTTSLARKKSGCAAVTLLFLLAMWARPATTWSALGTLRRAHLAVWDAEPRTPFAAIRGHRHRHRH